MLSHTLYTYPFDQIIFIYGIAEGHYFDRLSRVKDLATAKPVRFAVEHPMPHITIYRNQKPGFNEEYNLVLLVYNGDIVGRFTPVNDGDSFWRDRLIAYAREQIRVYIVIDSYEGEY